MGMSQTSPALETQNEPGPKISDLDKSFLEVQRDWIERLFR
jgi:hypothetical protein